MIYNTEKRAAIKDFLSKKKESAFSIEEICSEILVDGHGKSTVYRIISEMVKDGSVKKISDPISRRVCYQHLEGTHCSEHLHLKCNECGRLIHLDEKTTHELEEKLMSANHFVLDDGAMLFGKCESCAPTKQCSRADAKRKEKT